MYSGAAVHEQHYNPIHYKDNWALFGETAATFTDALDFGKLSALAAFLAEDKITGAPEIGLYSLQQKLRDLYESASTTRILEGNYPSQQVWKYYTLLDSLDDLDFGGYSEAEDEASVLRFDEGCIDRVRELYAFRNDSAVERFLRENLFLTELLLGVRKEVEQYFGPDVRLELEVTEEADAESSGRLFALILTALSPREAMSRLEELDHAWWLQALPKAQGKLTLDIEYD